LLNVGISVIVDEDEKISINLLLGAFRTTHMSGMASKTYIFISHPPLIATPPGPTSKPQSPI